MKPKNKFQQQVVETSKRLPELTKKQIQWGYDNAMEYIGQRTDKGKYAVPSADIHGREQVI